MEVQHLQRLVHMSKIISVCLECEKQLRQRNLQEGVLQSSHQSQASHSDSQIRHLNPSLHHRLYQSVGLRERRLADGFAAELLPAEEAQKNSLYCSALTKLSKEPLALISAGHPHHFPRRYRIHRHQRCPQDSGLPPPHCVSMSAKKPATGRREEEMWEL
jgi:hypothetical protein